MAMVQIWCAVVTACLGLVLAAYDREIDAEVLVQTKMQPHIQNDSSVGIQPLSCPQKKNWGNKKTCWKPRPLCAKAEGGGIDFSPILEEGKNNYECRLPCDEASPDCHGMRIGNNNIRVALPDGVCLRNVCSATEVYEPNSDPQTKNPLPGGCGKWCGPFSQPNKGRPLLGSFIVEPGDACGGNTNMLKSLAFKFMKCNRVTPTTPSGGSGGERPGATGDPHCMNAKGQRFDVHSTGEVTFVAVPRGGAGAEARGQDLTVTAQVEAVNSEPCSPTVITKVMVQGRWLGSAPELVLRPSANTGVPEVSKAWKQWMSSPERPSNVSFETMGTHPRAHLVVGPLRVDMFQRRGKRTGVRYFDMKVTGLKALGGSAGGILGLDDHTKEAKAAAGCNPHEVVRLDRHENAEETGQGEEEEDEEDDEAEDDEAEDEEVRDEEEGTGRMASLAEVA